MQAVALDRSRIFGTLAFAAAFALVVLGLAGPAQAQVSVDGTVDQVGQAITDTGGQVGDTITDTGGQVGDTVGGSTGGTVKDVTGSTGGAVKDTSSGVGSTVDKTVDTVTGAEPTQDGTRLIDDLLQGVGGTIDNVGGAVDDLTGTGTVRGSKKPSSDSPAGTGVLIRVPDRLTQMSTSTSRGVTVTPISTEPASARDSGVTFGDVIRRALEAVKRFAFPLALTLLVLAYLAANGWFDRRDPKLALAAVDPDADLLRFE